MSHQRTGSSSALSPRLVAVTGHVPGDLLELPSAAHTASTPPQPHVSRVRAASGAESPATPPSLDRTSSLHSFTKLSLEEYVKQKGGNRAIKKILIANNGIAAVKAIRSIRRWAYETFGTDRLIEFVVMATPEDIKANAAYIHLADEFVQVPGGSNNNNYANIQLITDIAERTGAQAVWPGWGHASENDRLPELLAQTKNQVVWIGPPPAAMRALGDKIGSTLIAQSAGVPCMGWSGSGLTVNYSKDGLPKDLYERACVHSTAEAVEVAERVGYPIMIKASEGGGGKGIRKVENKEDVMLAFPQVQGEVPGSPIFLMKLAPACRHLEVQLVADRFHNAISVHGRDCSIQRRHQKIIEEGPVVAAPPDVWRSMEQSAVRLAKEVGYVGAGTVEYLYMPDGTYCFLELNPRLQVEHPVTELISGVNLPAAQLQIAMGIPLHNIRGIRRMYGEHPDTDTPIDFDNRVAKTLPGHVIACRITAENPDSSFQPTSGVIQELNFRSTPDVWGYFSVSARGGIHEYSDSQFGHMFALGETREIARRNMVLAIKELSIRGDIRTTVEYLRMILETEDFRNNNLSTTWLERLMSKRAVMTERPPVEQTVVLGALWRTYSQQLALQRDYMSMLERGQLPPPSLHNDLITQRLELIYEKVKYVFVVEKSSPNSYELTINGWSCGIEVHTLADDGLLCILGNKKHVVYGQEFPSGLRLIVDGKTCLFHEEYDPTQLRSSMPGKLVRFLVADGSHVSKDKPYAEVEVMKMYISLVAPEDGVIKHLKPEGSIIEAGDLLASLSLDHPERVQKAELFTGQFQSLAPSAADGIALSTVNLALKEHQRKLLNLLSGYSLSQESVKKSVMGLMNALRAPQLPLEQFREALSSITSRIPSSLVAALNRSLDAYAETLQHNRFSWEHPEEFPVVDLQHSIDATFQSLPTDEERNKLTASLNGSGVTNLLQHYKLGNHGYAVHVLNLIWDEFYSVEAHFASSGDAERSSAQFVIKALRKQHKEDLEPVARVARSHHALARRTQLVVLLLDLVQKQLGPLLPDFLPALKKLATLNTRDCAPVVLKARQLIMSTELPSSSQRKIAIQTLLNTAATSVPGSEARKERLAPLIDQSQPIEDMIFHFFESKRPAIQTTAMEAYIRRIYQVYKVPYLECQAVKPIVRAITANGEDNTEEAGPTLIGRWHFHMDPASPRLEQEQRDNAKLSMPQTPQPGASPPSGGAAGSWPQGKPQQLVGEANTPPASALARHLGSSDSPSSTLRASSSRPVVSGRQMQNQYLLQKSDSVSDIVKLRAKKSSASTGGTTLPTEEEEDEDEVEYGEDDESEESGKEGSTVPAGSHLAPATTAIESATQSALSPASRAPPRARANVRQGVMGYFTSYDAMKKGFAQLLPLYDTSVKFVEPVHVLYVALKWGSSVGAPKLPPDDTLSGYLRTFLAGHESSLVSVGVRRVTFIISTPSSGVEFTEEYPAYFTFRHRLAYEEDTLVRHIEPITAAQLDLQRLCNFDLAHISTTNRAIHLFAGYPAKQEGKGVALHGVGATVQPIAPTASIHAYDGRRFFIRTLVRKLDGSALFQGANNSEANSSMPPLTRTVSGGYSEAELDAYTGVPEAEFAFVEALNALEIAMQGGGPASPFKNNSLYLSVLSTATIEVKYVEAVIRLMARRYSDKIKRLYVDTVEFNICIRPPQGGAQSSIAYRFVATNPTGYNLLVDTYQERKDPASAKVHFKLLNKHVQHGRSMIYSPNGKQAAMNEGPSSSSSFTWDGLEVSTPYPVTTPFQKQRQAAHSLETVYVWDWLPLLEHAIAKTWKQRYNAWKYSQATKGARRPSVVTSGSLLSQLTQQYAQSKIDADVDMVHSSLPEREHAYAELKSEEEASLSHFLPPTLLKAVELVLGVDAVTGETTLVQTERAPGNNNIGMVAWLLTLYTPEVTSSPMGTAAAGTGNQGRQVVLIANDITFQAGTFGPQEDLLFDLASKFARARGIPRWYFSANSGARIGLAEELRHKFQVAWQDNNPLKGFSYLYLSDADYPALAKSVRAEKIEVSKEDGSVDTRWMIKDIIGARDGLGVENLRGSGTIAGETSRAYEDIYTLTYVTSRTVGIGAYLARLGQRVIQKNSLPIILTGFSALNKLLGKAVYSSNVQLGGPDIMYTNGVSHMTVDDDLEGVMRCLSLLAYVPVRRHAPLPMLLPPFHDPVDRSIDFVPSKTAYDPRHMLAGCKEVATGPNGELTSVWQSGFLDRDSWTELLGGWARTAIVGRGRLGGLPLGIIAVETRTVEQVIPADPASPDSKEVVQQRAGQVWFPDSSFKTAQGIRDCIGEDLPLLIFANWRGFSGGQKDMFEEVLKFGALIVDALRDFRAPVMVYLPPHATLRGGAWVVVDQTINEQVMEMYADESARGGVLETEGTLDVKFRKKDILALEHRTDAKLQQLDAELAQLEREAKEKEQSTPSSAASPSSPVSSTTSSSTRTIATVKKEIAARESLLFPTYHQVATQFADLHDTPGRMQAKGCIQGTVPWAQARRFFYWRIQRKMEELKWINKIVSVLEEVASPVSGTPAASVAGPHSVVAKEEQWRPARNLLLEWVTKAAGQKDIDSNDQSFLAWVQSNGAQLEQTFQSWKSEQVLARMKQLIGAAQPAAAAQQGEGEDATVGGLAAIIQALSPQQKEQLKKVFT